MKNKNDKTDTIRTKNQKKSFCRIRDLCKYETKHKRVETEEFTRYFF